MSLYGLKQLKVCGYSRVCVSVCNFSIDFSYLAFTVIYVLECFIKLLGLGWKKVSEYVTIQGTVYLYTHLVVDSK